jgi:LPS export ABC transporter protein LptC
MSAGLAVLAVLPGCGSGPAADTDPDADPMQQVDSFVLVQSVEGLRSWRLESRRADYTEGDSILLLSGVDLTFFEEDAPSMILLGDSGRVDLTTGLLRIWGGVTADTEDGRHLETSELIWDDEMEVLHSDCLVTLTIPDSTGETILSGRGVDLDTGLGAGEGVGVEEGFTAVRAGEIVVD